MTVRKTFTPLEFEEYTLDEITTLESRTIDDITINIEFKLDTKPPDVESEGVFTTKNTKVVEERIRFEEEFIIIDDDLIDIDELSFSSTDFLNIDRLEVSNINIEIDKSRYGRINRNIFTNEVSEIGATMAWHKVIKVFEVDDIDNIVLEFDLVKVNHVGGLTVEFTNEN